MRKGKAVFVLIVSLMLGVGMMACGDGGSSSKLPNGVVTPLSVESWKVNDLDFDGKWAVWSAVDRERVAFYDGSLEELTSLLPECMVVHELAYDGTYLVIRANDTKKSYGEEGHSNLFVVDTTDSSPEAVWFDDAPFGLWGVLVVDGKAVYWKNEYEDVNENIYACDLTVAGLSPVTVSTTTTQNYSQPGFDGRYVAWRTNDGGTNPGVYLADLADLASIPDPVRVWTNSGVSNLQVDGGIVAWVYGSVVYAYDIAGEVGPVEVSTGSTNGNPFLDGGIMAWRASDTVNNQIYCADVSDLSSYMASTDILQLTTDGTNKTYPVVAGDYIAWVGDTSGDEELFMTDLSGGLAAAQTGIREVSSGYYDRGSQNWFDGDYSMSNSEFFLDALGNLVWTEFTSWDGEEVVVGDYYGDPWYETIFYYNYGDDDGSEVADLDEYRKVKDLGIVDGKAFWITRGAFERVWAEKVDKSVSPFAVSPVYQRGHQPSVGNGILAWSGKDGLTCVDDDEGAFDIFYADLEGDRTPFNVTEGGDGFKYKKPDVDGDNRFIVFKENENYEIYAYALGDPAGSFLLLEDYSNNQPSIDNGIVTWMNDESWPADILYADLKADVLETVPIGMGYYCPTVSGGVIAWMDNNYEIYYYDVLAAEPDAVKVTSEVNPNSPSQNGWNVSAGIIAFNAESEAGTEGIYAYAIGDPMDSVTLLWQAEDTDFNVCRPRIDQDLVAWIGEVELGDFDFTPSSDKELFLYDLSAGEAIRVTDNMVYDSKPVVANGIVLWRQGGSEGDGGNTFVHAFRP